MVFVNYSTENSINRSENNNSIKDINLIEGANSFIEQDSAFVQFGLQKQKECEDASFLQVSSCGIQETPQQPLPMSPTLFCMPSISTAFVEILNPINQNNKDVFTTILEKIEEQECSKVIACVSSASLCTARIMESLMSIGFQILPRNIAIGSGMNNYIWLSFEL